MTPIHGLTGGIGCGKSTVARLFAELGARIIDTDVTSHQLTQAGGTAIPLITQEFGPDYIDAEGALDRAKMRARIFSDEQAKQQLESILHPLILSQTKALANTPCDAPYSLVVVPLLFESTRYRDWLERVIVVDCSEEQQIRRTMQRNGLSAEMVCSIMRRQIGREERLRLADEVIHNEGTLEDLRQQVENLHSQLIKR